MATSSNASAPKPKVIMHLDMDAFFAAIEVLDNPAHRGKPLVVGAQPGGRGVVATCSYEARRFGIHSAMPVNTAKRLCPQAIFVPPRMERYAQLSKRLFSVLDSFSPSVQPLSIDEAFVDISGLELLWGSPKTIASLTQSKVKEVLGLTCSIGIGPNKLIAKIASDFRKPNGVTIVEQDEVQAFLDPMDVGRLYGVGPRTKEILLQYGITKVAQLRNLPLESLCQYVGKSQGVGLHKMAQGLGSDVVSKGEPRKTISAEHTFETDVSRKAQIRQFILSLSGRVGKQLREYNQEARLVTLRVRLAPFETHSRQKPTQAPIFTDGEIFAAAWDLFQNSSFVGQPIRLVGVGVSHLMTAGMGQLSLPMVQPSENRKQKEVARLVDNIRNRYGSSAIRRPGEEE